MRLTNNNKFTKLKFEIEENWQIKLAGSFARDSIPFLFLGRKSFCEIF